MPLSNVQLIMQLSATLTALVEAGAWPNLLQGPNQISANLAKIDLTNWDQAYVHEISLTAAGGATPSATIDLFSFTNKVNEAVAFSSLFLYAFQSFPNNPANSNAPSCSVTVVPAASNPLQAFFNGTGAGSGITLAANRTLILTDSTAIDPPAGDAVNATHRQLTFTNTGTDAVFVYVIILGK